MKLCLSFIFAAGHNYVAGLCRFVGGNSPSSGGGSQSVGAISLRPLY